MSDAASVRITPAFTSPPSQALLRNLSFVADAASVREPTPEASAASSPLNTTTRRSSPSLQQISH